MNFETLPGDIFLPAAFTVGLIKGNEPPGDGDHPAAVIE
jgi:hypothetical protein